MLNAHDAFSRDGGPESVERDEMLTEEQVRDITKLSRSTRARMARIGLFVIPVRLSARRIAYRRSEIEAWLAARESARRS